MPKYFKITILHFSCLLILLGCSNDDGGDSILLQADFNEQFSGGDFTVFNEGTNAFGLSGPTLSTRDRLDFAVGNSFFNQNWVTAPASTTARDGLGPYFNARACSNCHFKDGRGRPPAFDGEVNTGLLLQLSNGTNSATSGPEGHSIYGTQLQDQAILGVTPKGTYRIIQTNINGTYLDGEPYQLLKPDYEIIDLGYGPLSDVFVSPRVAPQLIGLGLLEIVPEEQILARQDINDSDGDGISGKANYVWDVENQRLSLGRFGWKANQPSLAQQNAGAFNGDMGLTTDIFPNESCPSNFDCSNIENGGSPEVSTGNFDFVTLYTSTLAVPARRNWEDQNVLRGKQLFSELNCSSCHTPNMTTGTSSAIPELSNQTIRPYTDLLLHDMGEDLTDGYAQFLATNREWRTPPLWGIGLIQVVNGHTRLLHDGRANGIEEAILWHGGEAQAAKRAFISLNKEDRESLLAFVNSL